MLLTTRNRFNLVNPPVAHGKSTKTRFVSFEGAAGGNFAQNKHVQKDTSVLGPDAGQYLLATGRPATSTQSNREVAGETSQQTNGTAAAFTAIQEFSGSGVPRGDRTRPGDDPAALRPSAVTSVRPLDITQSRLNRTRPENADSSATSVRVTPAEDGGNARPQQTSPTDARTAHSLTRVAPQSAVSPSVMPNSVEMHSPTGRDTTDARDLRDPHNIHHRNSVYYNIYPPDRRNRLSTRPLAGTGHGTAFFHNGETSRETHFFFYSKSLHHIF